MAPQVSKQEIAKVETQQEKKDDALDGIVMLVQTSIDALLLEEVMSTSEKMNRYRNVLAKGMLTFAEGHEGSRAKMDRFVDSFRTGWKVFKQNEDEKATLDVFMKAMNNELWVGEGVEVA